MDLQPVCLAERDLLRNYVSLSLGASTGAKYSADTLPSMYAASHNGVDYQVVFASTLLKTVMPIKTFVGIPPNAYQQQAPGFAAQFNAVDSMVCTSSLLSPLSLNSVPLTFVAQMPTVVL